MQPGRIVYVSCDPATLGRDVKRFAQYGYTAVRAAAVDLFPRTANIETVCLLEKGVVTGGTRIGGYLFSHGTREQDDIIELPVMEKAHMLGESV